MLTPTSELANQTRNIWYIKALIVIRQKRDVTQISQMSAIVPENIRILLSQYEFETDDDSISDDVTCTLCRKLMIDPYQTGCECKYCRECIVKYLSEGNNYCKGGSDECQENILVLDENVCRNPALNRKILKVRVRCPNTHCVFISTLAEMDEHLKDCAQQQIESPFTSIQCTSDGVFDYRTEADLNNETSGNSRLLMKAIKKLGNELKGVKEELRLNEIARGDILEQVKEERRLRREEKDELMGLMKDQKRELLKNMEERNARFVRDLKELKKKVDRGEEEKTLVRHSFTLQQPPLCRILNARTMRILTVLGTDICVSGDHHYDDGSNN